MGESLKKRMAKGVFWTALSKYSSILVQLVISMVLARLIAPEEFGVVAIATVIIAFIYILTDLGIGPAIIQNHELSKADTSSIFSFTLYVGVFFSLLLFVSSNPIADFYKEVKLSTICKFLSLQVLFTTWNMVPNALFMKDKRFKFIAIRTVFLQIITGIISIIYAFNGGGCYALIVSPIVTSILLFFIGIKEYPQKVSLKFDFVPLKKIFSFSIYQFLFNFMNYFSRNLDKLIIGKYIGMQGLGYYEKSYRLMLMPLQNVSQVIAPVIQPYFSEFQDDKSRIASYYNKITKLIATLSFPIGVVLFYCADELIRIFFGSNWAGAVPTFQILALSLPVQMIMTTSGSIYQSANSTKAMFWNGTLNTLITISGFIVSVIVSSTIEAFAVAFSVTQVIEFFLSYYIMYRIVLKSSLKGFFISMVHPAIVFVCLFVILGLTSNFIDNFNFLLSFIIKCLISLLVFVIFLYIFKDYNIKDIIARVKTRK